MRFKMNPRVADELGDEKWLQRFMLARGIDVRKGIRGNLPSGRGSGQRVASFSGRAYADVKGDGADLRVEVGTRWKLGHLFEYGSAETAAYAPIRKTVAQLGYRFEGA